MMYNISVNGYHFKVNSNLSVLIALQLNGFKVPRYCYEQRLNIAGNCRICLVELAGAPKPIASCAIPSSNGLKIFTTRPLVTKAQEGVNEFILLNHPLDCPICDQGGECDLQDQSYDYGTDRSRFFNIKRTISSQDIGPIIQIIITRCIHCTRCVRFLAEIDPLNGFAIMGRGTNSTIGTYVNTKVVTQLRRHVVNLCPVGALTSKINQFERRPWEQLPIKTFDSFNAEMLPIQIEGHKVTPLFSFQTLNSTSQFGHLQNQIAFSSNSNDNTDITLGLNLSRFDLQLLKYYLPSINYKTIYNRFKLPILLPFRPNINYNSFKGIHIFGKIPIRHKVLLRKAQLNGTILYYNSDFPLNTTNLLVISRSLLIKNINQANLLLKYLNHAHVQVIPTIINENRYYLDGPNTSHNALLVNQITNIFSLNSLPFRYRTVKVANSFGYKIIQKVTHLTTTYNMSFILPKIGFEINWLQPIRSNFVINRLVTKPLLIANKLPKVNLATYNVIRSKLIRKEKLNLIDSNI